MTVSWTVFPRLYFSSPRLSYFITGRVYLFIPCLCVPYSSCWSVISAETAITLSAWDQTTPPSPPRKRKFGWVPIWRCWRENWRWGSWACNGDPLAGVCPCDRFSVSLLGRANPGKRSTWETDCVWGLFKWDELLKIGNSLWIFFPFPDLHQVCALQELWIHNSRQRVGCTVVSRFLTVPRLCQTLC